MKIKVTDKISIGDGSKTFVIAEVGSNWLNIGDCIDSIKAAKEAGADAVKFQLFDYKSLYGNDKDHEVLEIGKMPFLDPGWLKDLALECTTRGIEFMCSSFSPELAEIVNEHVNVHKIASAEMNHLRLLEATNSFGKPVILSTAGSTIEEIKQSLTILKDVPVIVMYCVGAYPARDINMRCLYELYNKTKRLVGYSDHSTDIRIIPSFAVQNSAVVIEKHFKIRDMYTPDNGHSLNPHEFKIMVDEIRQKPSSAKLGESPEDEAMRTTYKRRLKVTRPIKAGEIFKENFNYGIYRSLTKDVFALSPYRISFVEGKKALKDLSVGQGVQPGDF